MNTYADCVERQLHYRLMEAERLGLRVLEWRVPRGVAETLRAVLAVPSSEFVFFCGRRVGVNNEDRLVD